jgi:hypothetical protein
MGWGEGLNCLESDFCLFSLHELGASSIKIFCMCRLCGVLCVARCVNTEIEIPSFLAGKFLSFNDRETCEVYYETGESVVFEELLLFGGRGRSL